MPERLVNRVAVIVGSSSGMGRATALRFAEEGAAIVLATNLTGAFHCTQAVLPVMRQQGEGLIIYISTVSVKRPDVSGVAYQASKHGMVGLAHGTMVEERDHGIRTSVIFPGLTDTPLLLQRPAPTPPEMLAKPFNPKTWPRPVCSWPPCPLGPMCPSWSCCLAPCHSEGHLMKDHLWGDESLRGD